MMEGLRSSRAKRRQRLRCISGLDSKRKAGTTVDSPVELAKMKAVYTGT